MTVVSRCGGLAYLLAISTVATDQITKSWALRLLDWGRRSIGVWGPLRFTLVENNGVSFGLFHSDGMFGRIALSAFSIAVVIAMAVWVRRADRVLSGVAVGLIMGGALGNVIDRWRYGSVVDFVDVQRLYFPWVFNLADSAITVGIALFIIETAFFPRKEMA